MVLRTLHAYQYCGVDAAFRLFALATGAGRRVLLVLSMIVCGWQLRASSTFLARCLSKSTRNRASAQGMFRGGDSGFGCIWALASGKVVGCASKRHYRLADRVAHLRGLLAGALALRS